MSHLLADCRPAIRATDRGDQAPEPQGRGVRGDSYALRQELGGTEHVHRSETPGFREENDFREH